MSFRFVLSVSALALMSIPAYAQAPVITVNAKPGSLTVPSVKVQEAQLKKTAGSVAFVDSEKYKDRYANTLKDVLQDTPGIFAQERYGQEIRISVRGSGLGRGFHTRGVEILQDGIPTNLADGSGDFYQIDPLSVRSTEIYKGGNGLFYGASTLGGAINFVTPTAYTATAPNILQLEGGSFGTKRTHAQISRVLGNFDFNAGGTVTRADGYRDHDDTKSEVFNGNIGYKISPDIETRFYGGIYNVDQDLPGALTLEQALHRPKMAAATALSGDQGRVTKTQRLANRTSFKLANGDKLDFDTWFIHKDLYHPIFQVIDQDGITYGAGPRYTTNFDIGRFKNELLLGARYFGGSNKARQFLNVSGDRGAQTLNAKQEANNYEAYFENRFWFMPQTALMLGAKAFHAERDYTDKGGLALNPTSKSDSTDYDGINPKIGVLWQPNENIQNFINLTRSQDVPDFSDLSQTIAATTQFVNLQPQDAWTVEIGSRGSRGRFGWDATAYRSMIKDELLQYTTGPGIPAATFNAGDTIHQGLEVGVSVALNEEFTFEQIWNYSDFHFDGDAVYGDNDIAGVPENVFRSSLTYRNKNGFYVTPNIDYVPDGAYADQANTLQVPGYTLYGLKTGVQLENGLHFYIDARNLSDEKYVSDIGAIRDARTTSTSIFYPGAGRSVFAGVKYEF